MELIDALEAYLVDTRQLHPLARRQARVLCDSVADKNRVADARMLLLINLLALRRGAPRASREFLLRPFAPEYIHRSIRAYRAENDDGNPAWADMVAQPGSLDQMSRLIDVVIEQPQCLAPVCGPAPDDEPAVWPLLVVGESDMGFSRYWHAATVLKRKLLARLQSVPDMASEPESVMRILGSVFGAGSILPPGQSFHFRQIAAAALALRNPFLVVSGGPGTGKTSVVMQILRALLRAFPDLESDRIMLCAPTGRATARLGETIDAGLAVLDRRLADGSDPDAIYDRRLGNLPRKTIHALLSYRPDGSARYNHENPLPFRVIVVDEVSMVDLCLFADLLDAASPDCRMILLGDMHQLPSVEAGAVLGDCTGVFNRFEQSPTISAITGQWLASVIRDFAPRDRSMELAAADAKEAGALVDRVVVLSRSYRSTGEILELAVAINRGDDAAALEAIGKNKNGVLVLNEGNGLGPVQRWLDACYTEEKLYAFRTLRDIDISLLEKEQYQTILAAAFGVLDESRILTLVHGGQRGRMAINALADRLLGKKLGIARRGPFFHGEPVILNRNLHHLDLYNGDIGMVLVSPGGGQNVVFRRGGQYAVHPLDRLSALEPGFAITVHKAQGSEFDAVLLVLPEYDSPLLTRQIIYTGITRARAKVMILGSEERLRAAIKNREERAGGIGLL